MKKTNAKNTIICHSEHDEQVTLVKWFRDNFPNCLIFAVPNGGKRGKKEAIKLQDEGVLAGVSDLIILFPNSKILFLEMKKIDGKASPEQIEFFDKLDDFGFSHIVGYGATDASRKILEFIKKNL